MEPEPPPVTIVDPAHPGTAEELASAPPPRRLWAWGLGLAVLLLAGVVLSTVRDDRRMDREAVASLQLSADGSLEPGRLPEGTVPVTIRNDGPAAVRVLTAQLLAPGYEVVHVDRRVGAGATAELAMKDTATCGRSMLDHPAEQILLRVRTSRGSTVTRAVTLSPSAFKDVNHAARERCGYLPADEAFSFQPTSVTTKDGYVVVRGLLANESLLPLELFRLEPAPGVEVDTSRELPIRLPPQTTAGAVTRTVPLALTIRVLRCDVFLGSFDGVAVEEVVGGWVVRDASLYEVPVLAFDPTSSFRPRVDLSAVPNQLLDTCTPRR